MIQLRFWAGPYPWSDLTPLMDKIGAELKMGYNTNYHFCGKPL
jgi:hypothetical protein